ncbi:hypothetical protein HZB60_03900 [candidate division KSB1 bacterium]|nr:hypothetical protein [candidate division KSB1 bacterium]
MRNRVVTLLLLIAAQSMTLRDATAQVWGQYAFSGYASGWCSADNSCFNPYPSPTENSFFANTLFANIWGHQLGLAQIREEEESTGPMSCEQSPTTADGYTATYAYLDGVNTNAVTISYMINPVVYCYTEQHRAVASDTLDVGFVFDVTGAPPGSPITIYVSWDHFGGISGPYGSERPPFYNEDENCWTTARIWVNGMEQLLGRFDFNLATISGFNQLLNQSFAINTFVGQALTTVEVELIAYAEVNDPCPLGNFGIRKPDENSANQNGMIRLSIDAPNPLTEPDSLYTAWLDFSVDIGGDAELSDTPSTGNEVFDPADVYQWHTPLLPPGGVDGMYNDEVLYGFDPPPVAPDGPPPLTGAPCGVGPYGPLAYLDIDDYDFLDFNLSSFAYGPNQGPIGFFLAGCVHDADNFFISFDDDEEPNWANPFSVATSSGSPMQGDLYGQAGRHDEVLGLTVAAMPGGAPVVFQYPFQSELELHPSLGPDPDGLMPQVDDDVDGLDIRTGQCNVWYFSVDHEASFGLNPGAVYEKLGGGPGGGFIMAVDPAFHLGLPLGVDLDAMEFCWLYSNVLGGAGLALMFSVDVDDPFTPEDESGFLDPGMIYFSFLDGVSLPYLVTSLGENIDALAAWDSPLYTNYITPPSPCAAVGDLTIQWVSGQVNLNFTAPQAGTFTLYQTTNPNQPTPPPSPGWITAGTATASAAGQLMGFTVSAAGTGYANYAVISRCP